MACPPQPARSATALQAGAAALGAACPEREEMQDAE